jgi:hypothetical protein
MAPNGFAITAPPSATPPLGQKIGDLHLVGKDFQLWAYCGKEAKDKPHKCSSPCTRRSALPYGS